VNRAPQIVIVGGGTMGLAAAWALARRGARATVLERHAVPHEHGSHSGFTRVIRQAYHEGAHYVSLVQEAQAEFEALGRRVGEPLLVRTGLLEFGPRDDVEFEAAIAACRTHGVPLELVDAASARTRWPFRIPDGWSACFTPSGGYLRVAACLAAFSREARAGGAIIREHTGVREIHRGEGRLCVSLESGERIEADRIVITAGVELPELLPDLLASRITRLRRVLAWSRPRAEQVAALRNMPVWAAFHPEGFFYGFPYGEEGIRGLKVARHAVRASREDGSDEPVDPRTVDRDVHAVDLEPLERFMDEMLPGGRGPWAAHRVCLYTVTPSWDFVVDRDPVDPRVVIAGGFSGHGFKFSPTIGRLVAQLVLDENSQPLEPFRIARHRAWSA
jgi:monomeric sarcosine oxidase